MASFQRSHAKHPCTGAAIDRHHPPPHSACWRASSHSCLKAPAGRAGSSLKGAGMYYPIAEEELQVVQDCMQQISLLVDRSEEHTSELQSRQYLVCRLLLEKKKQITLHVA